MGHNVKKILVLALFVFVIYFCVYFAYPFIKKYQHHAVVEQNSTFNDLSGQSQAEQDTITINNSTLHADIANTEDSRNKGLGGRASLGADQAMLFVFDTPSLYSFWMKDMLFPIDIAWVDSNYSIIFIQSDVSPSTYPNSFSPDKPAHYVIETNAGYFSSHNISVGDTVDIQTQ